MTTINAVGVGLSGATGTGNFVGANTPTLITPILGAATATSVTFSPTTGGIVGTTTNDNAGAGKVGEYVESIILSSGAISISNSVAKDITSISLTAGDWDVWGAATGTASANMTAFNAWISSTSATPPDSAFTANFALSASAFGNFGAAVPQRRFSLSTTTTIYLTIDNAFTVTGTAFGFIAARRAR